MTANVTSPFQTLTRPNAVDDIVEVFKEAIIRGDLRPGLFSNAPDFTALLARVDAAGQRPAGLTVSRHR